jgi:hypothetical protein
MRGRDIHERALVKHALKERFGDSEPQIKIPLLATLPKIDYIGVALIELGESDAIAFRFLYTRHINA